MRRTIFLFFFIVSIQTVWSQKIKYTIANGLQIEGLDESNPVIYDNDMVLDSPEDEFLWLKAHNGKVKLVGNIITRDMIGCVFPVGQTCNLTLQQTMEAWNSTWDVAQAAGLKNVPKPIAGAGEILLRPASGRIEDTRFKSSPGADLIISEAHKASVAKPLVILVGGNVSTVANAYLKDPSIAPKVLVLQIHGYHNAPNKTVSYNTTDPWATYVVMKKFKYVNWAGDSRSWYWTPRKNVNLTQAMVNTLPNNPLANGVKTWYQRFFARESLADAPMVLYFFNHSLWRTVERRMENGTITSSDNFDYLMVSGNNWTTYGPDLINYMKDPNNYLANPQPKPNNSPTVQITSPVNNSQHTSNSTITISASAADNDGTVSRVEFYSGDVKLGQDDSAPFSFAWTNTIAGKYTITAKAFDDKGASAISAVINLTVQVANTAPQIIITSPVHNESIEHGSSVSISAHASDATGSVTKVEFYIGATKVGEDNSGPFTVTWNNPLAGSHSITAKAFDDKGLSTTSSAVTLTILPPNSPPTVAITSPAHNASVEFENLVSIAVNASDATGSVVKVEFYSGKTKIGEDLTPPFAFTWNNPAVGNHSITAKAFDDMGLSSISPPVTINIKALNTAPSISITSPAHSADIAHGTSVTIAASATDALGTISTVEFYAGTTKLGEDSTNPFTFVWNGPAIGDHVITAKATDDKGLSTISHPVTITIFTPNTAPTVAITTPNSNTQHSEGTDLTIAATASDATGTVTKVEFYAGAEKIGTDTSAPFSFVWNNIPAGNHSLTAKAFDNLGLTRTSAVTTITVASSPIIIKTQITSPGANATFNHGSAITIAANATVSEGTISRVEFFNNGTKLGEDNTSPYSYTWIGASVGKHSLTVKATTNQQASLLSQAIEVEVKTPVVVAQPTPSISITEPQSNDSFGVGSTVRILAEVNPIPGLSKVEFYANNVKVGEAASSPFILSLPLRTAGSYRITAKAISGSTILATTEIQLHVVGHPIADAGEKITITLPQNSVTLKGTGKAADGSYVEHAWTQLSGPHTVAVENPNIAEIIIDHLVEGTYTFEYSVTDSRGLVAKDQIHVDVLAAAVVTPEITLPNIPRFFTPNDDGINDVWELPEHELFENAVVTIFNSAGQKIYESLSHEIAWDGKLEGKPLQEDAYYYIIRMSDSNDIKGAVRIIR